MTIKISICDAVSILDIVSDAVILFGPGRVPVPKNVLMSAISDNLGDPRDPNILTALYEENIIRDYVEKANFSSPRLGELHFYEQEMYDAGNKRKLTFFVTVPQVFHVKQKDMGFGDEDIIGEYTMDQSDFTYLSLLHVLKTYLNRRLLDNNNFTGGHKYTEADHVRIVMTPFYPKALDGKIFPEQKLSSLAMVAGQLAEDLSSYQDKPVGKIDLIFSCSPRIVDKTNPDVLSGISDKLEAISKGEPIESLKL